jgi:MOSC domain-containing protein YiiM
MLAFYMSLVEAIFVAPVGGSQMQRVPQVDAVQGKGLAGDRYAERRGYWSGSDECQVTLIEAEGLDEITSATSVDVSAGQHRRNIVTRGVNFHALMRKRFRVGEAVLEYDRPRPPCRYIQSVSERGMTKALGRGRGGICARVIESGTISVGDAIEILSSVTQAGRRQI